MDYFNTENYLKNILGRDGTPHTAGCLATPTFSSRRLDPLLQNRSSALAVVWPKKFGEGSGKMGL